MAPFLLYGIKLSCYLTVFYLGYKFLLSHETFFHFNRKTILIGLLMCMLLPLVKIRTETVGILQQPMSQLEKIMTEEEQSPALTINGETAAIPLPNNSLMKPVSFARLLFSIFAVGCFVNSCLLFRSYFSLYRMIRNGRKIKQNGYFIILSNRDAAPFNFGRYIVLSEKDYSEQPDAIIRHELAHLRFKHTIDIFFMELLSLFQWFNPVIRALKYELQKVHEFQADAEVIKSGVDVTGYELLLMRKSTYYNYFITNTFNHSKLKIRIIMMLKNKSNRWARLKLLGLLPVAALSMYAFAGAGLVRQFETVIQSDVFTVPLNDPVYSPEFFELALNRYIAELNGNTSVSADEKMKFLSEKTNTVKLLVNYKDEIMVSSHFLSTCTTKEQLRDLTKKIEAEFPKKPSNSTMTVTYSKSGSMPELKISFAERLSIEELSANLLKRLVFDYTNGKPALIDLQYDRGTSPEIVNEIYQIVGKVFTGNHELFEQKKQPVLLIYVEPRIYKPKE